MPEHHIAIDNVCAWPNLTQLPDGTIVATIFNQPCHGLWEGDVDCYASDDGRFWKYRGTPAPHEPQTNRMNVAAGCAHNGDLIVMASGWSHKPPRGKTDIEGHPETRKLPLWLSRSSDGGHTWHIDRDALRHLTLEGRTHPIPFGDVTRGTDGSLGVTCYSAVSGDGEERTNTAHFVRSTDDGKTWSAPILLAQGNNETALLHLGGAQWLAAARVARTGSETRGLDLLRSTDNGDTWQVQRPISLERHLPAHLLRLADGRILLTYSSRCIGMFGIHARFSTDDGVTWTRPTVIIHYDDRDSGYPSSVQRADGAIVTAYYHKHRPHHQRYHMGVMIWRFEEFFPHA